MWIMYREDTRGKYLLATALLRAIFFVWGCQTERSSRRRCSSDLWGGVRKKKGGMLVGEEVFMCFLMAMGKGELRRGRSVPGCE